MPATNFGAMTMTDDFDYAEAIRDLAHSCRLEWPVKDVELLHNAAIVIERLLARVKDAEVSVECAWKSTRAANEAYQDEWEKRKAAEAKLEAIANAIKFSSCGFCYQVSLIIQPTGEGE